jgi:hypothetical protein
VSITELKAKAMFNPAEAVQEIMDVGEPLDYRTRATAAALNVSYFTFLRVLRDLKLYKLFRENWADAKKAKREAGK